MRTVDTHGSTESNGVRGALRRFHHRLVRSRIVNERYFGQPRLGERLLRIRFLSAFLLSAPALALTTWYAITALGAHWRHAAATEDPEPLSLELFHLHLHDRLRQDWRRLTMPEPLERSQLPTYGLMLSNDNLGQLERQLPPGDGDTYYVNGHFTRGEQIYPVRVRYRGSKAWHWLNPQKSWKVRVEDGLSFDGRTTFNLLNTPEPIPFDEHVVLEIARELGLLAPDYYPFRLIFNNVHLGVYFFETSPDEGMLRREQRMPGSIYSGNQGPIDPITGVDRLWKSPNVWQKVCAVKREAMNDISELEALLEVVERGTNRDFARFAERALDLEKYALFDALDIVFGTNQHDFGENHKLYFDPYRGRFEPIAWNFRGGQHEREFNRVENPLLLRLKQLPRYVSLRNAAVKRLLDGRCSPEALERRTAELLEELAPDQERDGYWDAYELLPRMGTYYRQLLRPMDRELQAAVVKAKEAESRERDRYLREVLAGPPPRTALGVAPPDSGELTVDLLVEGFASFALTEVGASWPSECVPEEWHLFADTNLSDELEFGEDLLVASGAEGEVSASELELFPATQIVSRPPHPTRGVIRTEPAPQRYRFFVSSDGCPAEHLTFRGKNQVTEEPFEVSLEVGAVASVTSPPPVRSCADDVFRAEPGAISVHPWCSTEPGPEEVSLGPGEVEVPETLVFEAHQSVAILPGTRFLLGEGASMIFLGRVEARGEAEAPIVFEPKGRRWGGVALQGPATAGSRWSHVHFRNGTQPLFGLIHLPGMVNVHDTEDVSLDHLLLRDNAESDDALHVAYVRDLRLKDSRFVGTAFDAIDLEFSQADLERITIIRPGDDCLDLMSSELTVRDTRLVACANNAISAGEETRLSVRDSLAARGARGILIKNSSTVELEGVLLYDQKLCVRLEPESQWYPGRSHVRGKVLHAVKCEEQVLAVGRKVQKLGRIESDLAPDALPALRGRVLGLESWSELDPALRELTGGPKP